MLELNFFVDGDAKRLPLIDAEIRFGRSSDNEVVLPDYSVSRRHAILHREPDGFYIADQNSTNGVVVNGKNVQRSIVRAGDLIKIGIFEITVRTTDPPPQPASHMAPPPPLPNNVTAPLPFSGAPPAMAPPVSSLAAVTSDSAISNATIVRSLKDLSAQFGFDLAVSRDSSMIRQSKRKALDEAYSSQVFGFLSRLARLLITSASDDEILSNVMDIAFEAFPVDRGFILLRDEKTGELICELVRHNNRTDFRPQSEVPISKTMLEAVIREKVALLTYDALSDRRLAGTESVRIHQIRAAMCAPLWAGEKIIGCMQLDTPHHTGTFTEPDVDLLATLSNYAAVAIERNRNARDAEFQREVRNRLSRYHSPSVIEEVMQEGGTTGNDSQKLRRAEVTVLFADIVGFTAYSEKASPEEVAALMETYFTQAVEAIFSHGGTLDKFIGDCVMAFFGAPRLQQDHALRAVSAAVKIRESLLEWNAERERQGLAPIRSRIAVNTGPVVVGDIGSNRRVDYTVLGNTVNVASRLESAVAKPGDIVIGDETFRLLAGRIPTEALGDFELKGLSQKIVAHRVL